MTALEILQSLLLITGALMFVVGSIGLLRFPDTYTRIHALTKADNVGLGLIIIGLIPASFSLLVTLKLLLIWLLVMLASALSGHLVAWEARAKQVPLAPSEGESNDELTD